MPDKKQMVLKLHTFIRATFTFFGEEYVDSAFDPGNPLLGIELALQNERARARARVRAYVRA